MSPEAQRIAIAEACGWHSFRDIDGDGETRLWGHPANMKATSLPTELVPDYLNDLNAMHEAEKVITPGQEAAYEMRLRYRCGKSSVSIMAFNATAAQRAEAILRTLNLWTE